ncbi:MAG TPA: APC family permease [Phycisphaeraceae bacterium]
MTATPPTRLPRQLGVFAAVMLGLGSIVGTGVFVSTGLAAGVAGPSAILAVILAAGLATCNGLSSAQLASAHAVAGGTYEYGYRFLRPGWGFLAGWMFLAAKTASAATAALGFAGYGLHLVAPDRPDLQTPVALAVTLLLTLLVLAGMKRTSRANTAIVCVTLTALLAFIAAGLPTALERSRHTFTPFFPADQPPLAGLLHATALMFVAYTGYGRIATLGEEVRRPRQSIPAAILITLAISAVLYVGVVGVAIGVAGAQAFEQAAQQQAAPLQVIAMQFPHAGRATAALVAIGAMTAMLGVLLNLILGLSRVVLAMGRRGDLPRALGALSPRGTPAAAVILTGLLIATLTLIGSVKANWSFSAFTVLIYYGITNAAALRLPPERRLYRPWWAWMGLIGCLFLAFWVEPVYWGVGLILIAIGLAWHRIAQRLASSKVNPS